MSISRPYGGCKITAVPALAEIAVFHTFLIYIISLFDFYSCVNNRDKADMTVFHFLYKRGKVFKIFIYCEIFIGIHIVDIHIDHIQRKMTSAVPFRDFFKVLPGLIAPAALAEAKCEFRRNIAPSDDVTELFYDIAGRVPVDNIQIQICILTGNIYHILLCIPDVKRKRSGIIYKQSEGLLPGYNQKIVSSVQRHLLLRVLRIIRAETGIFPAPLIYAPVCLTQTKNNIILIHTIRKTEALLRADRSVSRIPLSGRNRNRQRLCVKRRAVNKFLDHTKTSLIPECPGNYYKAIIRQKMGKSLHHACRIIVQSCQGSDPFGKGYVPFASNFQNIPSNPVPTSGLLKIHCNPPYLMLY